MIYPAESLTYVKHLVCRIPTYYMGHHIMKWAKLNFVARPYDPYVQGHKSHNGVRQISTWPISLCGDPYTRLKGPINGMAKKG